MKLDKIEVDLCVNVVAYPHEEIEALNCAVKAHEEQRQKYYKLWCNSLDDLHKERLLTNETLMTAETWKRKYEELFTEYNRMTTKSEGIYNTLHEAHEYLYQKQHETECAWFKDSCESKQKYEELLVNHAKVLEENVKCQNNANIDLDNFSDLLAQHNKLQDKYTDLLGELEQNKVTTQELIAEFNRVITQLYMGNLTALVLPKL